MRSVAWQKLKRGKIGLTRYHSTTPRYMERDKTLFDVELVTRQTPLAGRVLIL